MNDNRNTASKPVLKMFNVSGNLVNKRKRESDDTFFYSVRFCYDIDKNIWGSFTVPVSNVKEIKINDAFSRYDITLGPSDHNHKVTIPKDYVGGYRQLFLTSGELLKIYRDNLAKWKQKQLEKTNKMNALGSSFEIATDTAGIYKNDIVETFINFEKEEINGISRDTFDHRPDFVHWVNHTKAISDSHNHDSMADYSRQDKSELSRQEKVRRDKVNEELKDKANKELQDKDEFEITHFLSMHSKSRNSVSQLLSLSDFNKSRGLSVFDSETNLFVMHTSADGITYRASVCGDADVSSKTYDNISRDERMYYALSDSELEKLDSGDYIIVSDVPGIVKDVSKPVKKYLHYKIHLDEDKKCLVRNSISITDPLFADPYHNERYAMHQSFYDDRISSVHNGGFTSIERKEQIADKSNDQKSDAQRTVRGPQKNPYQPTLQIKAYSKISASFYSYEKLNEVYQKLRALPASKGGNDKYKFESAYDENRFNKKKQVIEQNLKISAEHFDDYINSVVANYDHKTIPEQIRDDINVNFTHVTSDGRQVFLDTKGIGLQKNLKMWEARKAAWENEEKLRREDCVDEFSKELGLKSRWEEQVLSDYKAIESKWNETGVIEKSERTSTIIFNYHRLMEMLMIRAGDLDLLQSTPVAERSALGVKYFDGTESNDVPDF